MSIMHSYMGRIAEHISSECDDDDDENAQMCAELTKFWNTGDEQYLSAKAKDIWESWKACKVAKDSNVDLVNEWEGK